MAYKILYVEDQVADSIKDDLERYGYEVVSNDADSLDDLLNAINDDFDVYVFDFRLTSNKGRLDAPAIAQAMRTKGINYKEKPIILISNEDKLKEFDKDLTSQDLFDFAISKGNFRANISKYSNRINSFIESYKKIKETDFDLKQILGISESDLSLLIDYRLLEKLQSEKIKNDVYAYCRFINISLIRGIGPLIGEDVLSSRLGVSRKSKNWSDLLKELEEYKYKGILSDVYPRWWMEDILKWWALLFDGKSLRRTNSNERASLLKSLTDFDLTPIEPMKNSNSTYFWTICIETKEALDPNEGFIVNKKENLPWQEMEYLSLDSALEQSKYRKYLSPIDRNKIREIEK